jgi:hypothetical protein
MSDSDFEINGIVSLREEFDDRIEDWSGGGTVFVGTAVEYSLFVEFGTSKMDARPFFRPAINDARTDTAGFLSRNTQTSINEIDSAERLVRTLALAVERRVKEIITQKGLIDTGTMRASIVAVPTESALPEADDFSGDNVPPSAGRGVTETVEI